MLIYETIDNNSVELKVKGENRPLSFHYDNEFLALMLKEGSKEMEVRLNFEDLSNLVEELSNYLIVIETKKNMSDNRRRNK